MVINKKLNQHPKTLQKLLQNAEECILECESSILLLTLVAGLSAFQSGVAVFTFTLKHRMSLNRNMEETGSVQRFACRLPSAGWKATCQTCLAECDPDRAGVEY